MIKIRNIAIAFGTLLLLLLSYSLNDCKSRVCKPVVIVITDTITDTVDNCALIQAEQDSLHASWDRWENE